MALDLDELGAAARLSAEHERIVKEHTKVYDEVQKAADRMRDIIDPPALRRMRAMHDSMLAMVNPLHTTQARELFGSLDLKPLADMFAGVTRLDPELFGGSIAKRLADDWKLIGTPVDHLAGLKGLMSATGVSSMIAKSLALEGIDTGALARSASIFGGIDLRDHAKEMHELFKMSAAAERVLSTLDASRGFADLLGVHDVTQSLVEYESGRLNRAYNSLAASIVNRPGWLASAPDFVRTVPGDMIFAQARFLRTVTTHEEVDDQTAADEIWEDVQTQTLGYIEAVLPELNPKLMKSWEGAWDVAKRRGPDWARQAASSMRFLLIETLESVAPMDQVKKSKLPEKYIVDGQILRLGQIHWLCEPVQNRTYGKVVRADLDSAMTIIEAMNEAVHRDDYEEIEDAFRTMAVRAAVALCNLLKLWKARN
jgi:hypothetical protein